MNVKLLLKNTIIAFFAQGVSMMVSIVMSLVVPKVLGVEEYGYWQLFIFYSGYSGFFLMGLNDGIYLLNGGRPRSKVNKVKINSQFRFAVLLELVIGISVIILSLKLPTDYERSFVIAAFAVYTVIANLGGFLGYIFQAMNETRLFSLSVILDKLVFLLPLLFMVVLRVSMFELYVLAYIASKIVTLAWCCWQARDILAAGSMNYLDSVRESIASIRVGSKLMIANIADMLILGVARALVDAAWGIEAFGRVSFSLSLVNFFITFVTQASMVLFPALRQSGEEERLAVYQGMRDAMELIFPAIYILYFPMEIVLTAWLPQYAESMRWLAVLLPVCVFNTKMDVCCTTYFKVLRKERTLLAVNIATVAASTAASLVGVYVLGSLEAVLMGAVCCIAARSAWSERRLDGMMGVKRSTMLLPEFTLTIIFVAIALLSNGSLWSLLVYCGLYGLYVFFNKGVVVSVVKRVKSLMG